jgi:hypothetical protein
MVMRDKYIRSFPAKYPEKPLRAGDRGYVVTLASILERAFSTDAHFVAYTTSRHVRVNRNAFELGIAVSLNFSVFDVDCQETHGAPDPAPTAWRSALREKVVALFGTHGSGYYYETKGGARIIYRQDEPTVIRSEDDARTWSQHYAIAVAHLASRFGIVADPACSDWQRCFRLPHATRDHGKTPENWPSFGDPERISPLLLKVDLSDVVTARRSARRSFSKRIDGNFTPCADAGDGLLFRMLRGRGDILGTHAAGAFIIRCPNESAHSTGATGDGSTILFPPTTGQAVGWICCRHAHCSGFTMRDWLRCFSEAERNESRADSVRAA